MKQWTDVLIPPHASIREAIRTIDAGSLQIALVIDPDRRLLGTVTDGDVRRGILQGLPLDSPVSAVMNANPTFAIKGQGRSQVLTMMRLKQLRHIPVVDEAGRLVDVEILDGLIHPREKENWVLLMAGGLGSRLRPLTDDCPKPLLRVGGKPILETILSNFVDSGFRRFYLSVNYKAEMIESHFGDGSQWGAEIRYLHEEDRMGTAGALSLLPERPTAPLIVMNGDLLTKINADRLLDFHVQSGAAATMCVREYSFQIPYGVMKIEDNLLVDIEEKPRQNLFINAGIYALNPEVLDLVPPGSPFDMPDVFKALIDLKQKTLVFPIREYWLDIGQIQDFERANGEFYQVF